MESNVVGIRDTRVTSGEFGDYAYRKFLWWAFGQMQTKGLFLRNVAVNRTEDPVNAAGADDAGNFYSQLYGIPVEELQEILLKADKNGVSIVELHNRLKAGVRGDALFKRAARGQRKKTDDVGDLPNGTDG